MGLLQAEDASLVLVPQLKDASEQNKKKTKCFVLNYVNFLILVSGFV